MITNMAAHHAKPRKQVMANLQFTGIAHAFEGRGQFGIRLAEFKP